MQTQILRTLTRSCILIVIIFTTGCSKNGGTPNNPTTPTTSAPTVKTEAVQRRSSFEYQCEGIVTNEGGTPITERGVCWSVRPNPTKTDSVFISPNTSIFIEFPRLTANVKYYVRAFATNAKGTSYGNEVTFTPKIDLGMIYGGGVVFLVDATNTHGLTAAPANHSTKLTWAPGSLWTTSVATSNGNGAGNTTKIITTYGNTGSYAAKVCRDYRGGNYTDWYLPSNDELYWLKINQRYVPGFPATGQIGVVYNYWSSSQTNYFNAKHFEFSPDNIYFIDGVEQKNRELYVRAVRSF